MKQFAELTQRGQVARLRKVAEMALAQYELDVTALKSLLHLENTTFRVDSGDERFVLRINRPGHRNRDEIRSEALWLEAIHRDTDLVVPRPVRNREGQLVTPAGARGVPEERSCILFRRVEGQSYRKRLSPVALRRVGRLTAHLHEHARRFQPPPGFTRHNVEWGNEEEPGEMERLLNQGLRDGAVLIAPHDLATFTLARHHLRSTMSAMDADPSSFGLIHADLHHGNCLFYDGEARAIDFDDCGWGHFLYDLAVTQWYLQARPDFMELREAHLAGYREVRPLSEEAEADLPLFLAARTLLMAAYMAGRTDNADLRERAPQFIARCAGALRDFISQEGPEFV